NFLLLPANLFVVFYFGLLEHQGLKIISKFSISRYILKIRLKLVFINKKTQHAVLIIYLSRPDAASPKLKTCSLITSENNAIIF
ncbi:hypothetical protein, partial [Companilactobacillus nantensis]|uniref:hypothetical protein n=1 Tax=Companilactobacillus nantensis TaxID=305793 RepID=UPI001C991E19